MAEIYNQGDRGGSDPVLRDTSKATPAYVTGEVKAISTLLESVNGGEQK